MDSFAGLHSVEVAHTINVEFREEFISTVFTHFTVKYKA